MISCDRGVSSGSEIWRKQPAMRAFLVSIPTYRKNYCSYDLSNNLFLHNGIITDGIVTIEWKPYMLSPNTPDEGEDLMEHLAAKYGRAAVEKFGKPGNPLDLAGKKVGINFNQARRFINTVKGHQLMEYCNRTHPEKSNELMEKLFHAYFEEAKDLSKVPELLSVASIAGLDTVAVETVLQSNQFRDDVLRYDHQVKTQLRVSGVPYFIIESNKTGERPTAFSGAQPPEVIAEVLLEAQDD